MRIANVRIENFRCFRDETINLNDYTCLVGANGVGKSNVLTALRIFFRDATASPMDLAKLHDDDFHGRDTSKTIRVTVTFSQLEPEAVEDFRHYVRQEMLVISAVAVWNEATRAAEVKQYGQRMVMGQFIEFFRAEGNGGLAPELKSIYTRIRESFNELPPPGSKAAMTAALRTYEEAHPELCELHQAEDQFYGFSNGTNLLEKYIQWIFVPAVKDASTEQLEAKKTALGLLLERTVRTKLSFLDPIKSLKSEIETKYGELLKQNQGVLESLSRSLTERIQDWAHPQAQLELVWRNDPSKYISIQEPLAEILACEGQFKGTIGHFGHGFQRSFLIALLQELSGCRKTGNPKMLLACEEPELYQHPPQARHLSSVLQELGKRNAQVIVSTHSPYFVSGRGFQDVRLLRLDAFGTRSCVVSTDFEQLAKLLSEVKDEKLPAPTGLELKVEQVLQPVLNEMFFASILVLVEGLEDVGFISSYLTISDRYDEFRRLGCHVVSTSGKGQMVYPLAIAKLLDIPTFVIFDADGHDVDRADRRIKHERDNLALLRLCEVRKPEPFPKDIFTTPSLVMWPSELGAVIRDDLGKSEWEKFEGDVRKRRSMIGAPDLEKNVVFVGMVITAAFEAGKHSSVLEKLCDQIISFGRSVRSTSSAAVASTKQSPEIQ